MNSHYTSEPSPWRSNRHFFAVSLQSGCRPARRFLSRWCTLSVCFALVCSHSLSASLLFLSVMTPLLSALQASCRGDWSKGADERASTITFVLGFFFFFHPLPSQLEPPPSHHLSPADLSPSIHSNICHPFVAWYSGGKCCRRGAYSNISTWSDDLPAACTDHTFANKSETEIHAEWHLICFLDQSQPAEAQIHIYDVHICVWVSVLQHACKWSLPGW